MTKDSRDRPTPRKQPRQARAVTTMESIVEAAARILEDEGHANFSTNAVARRAGVSIGSLYQYFPSKDAIVGALLCRETGLLIAESEAALGAETGYEALNILIAASAAHQFRRPGLARLLDFEEARLPLSSDTQVVGQRMRQIVQAILARPDMPQYPDMALMTRDVVAILKGMIDAEGACEMPDIASLQARVRRAILGYLAG